MYDKEKFQSSDWIARSMRGYGNESIFDAVKGLSQLMAGSSLVNAELLRVSASLNNPYSIDSQNSKAFANLHWSGLRRLDAIGNLQSILPPIKAYRGLIDAASSFDHMARLAGTIHMQGVNRSLDYAFIKLPSISAFTTEMISQRFVDNSFSELSQMMSVVNTGAFSRSFYSPERIAFGTVLRDAQRINSQIVEMQRGFDFSLGISDLFTKIRSTPTGDTTSDTDSPATGEGETQELSLSAGEKHFSFTVEAGATLNFNPTVNQFNIGNVGSLLMGNGNRSYSEMSVAPNSLNEERFDLLHLLGQLHQAKEILHLLAGDLAFEAEELIENCIYSAAQRSPDSPRVMELIRRLTVILATIAQGYSLGKSMISVAKEIFIMGKSNFTNNAPVGAIQVGNDNTANVQQNIGIGGQELTQIFAQMRQELEQLPEVQRAEALEYLGDLETESKADEPKQSRLKSSGKALWELASGVFSAVSIAYFNKQFGVGN